MLDQENTPLRPEETEIPQALLPEDDGDMVTVADIHFRSNTKVYFFDPGELTLKPGDHVIIDTARGLEYGICAAGNHTVPPRDKEPPPR